MHLPSFAFRHVLFLCGILAQLNAVKNHAKPRNRGKAPRTISNDPQFERWPDKNNIPFYIDATYTDTERQLIREAASRVSRGTAGCVNFVESSSTDTRFKVKITKSGQQGTTFCSSWPGILKQLKRVGEQTMVITGGPNGCLDALRVADIMKYFAILVGRRNEFQRGDRDKFIALNAGNIVNQNIYRLYTNTDATWGQFPYDYCSITHNKPTDGAKPNTSAFSWLAVESVPKTDRLSKADCQLISGMYGCAPNRCEPSACENSIKPKCGIDRFCTTSPDESANLLGPYIKGSLALFCGQCVMEYIYDFDARALVPQGATVFSDFFPGAGASQFSPPVTFAYTRKDTNTVSLNLVMDNQKTTGLQCQTNPNRQVHLPSKEAVLCPNPPTLVPIPHEVGTSATSQVSSEDTSSINHYVVDSTYRNIKLMNTDFSKTLQESTNFLAGQSTITKITAIQLLQDLSDINQEFLGVFGTGADGKTPYFGTLLT